jgi:hypothetical protein
VGACPAKSGTVQNVFSGLRCSAVPSRAKSRQITINAAVVVDCDARGRSGSRPQVPRKRSGRLPCAVQAHGFRRRATRATVTRRRQHWKVVHCVAAARACASSVSSAVRSSSRPPRTTARMRRTLATSVSGLASSSTRSAQIDLAHDIVDHDRPSRCDLAGRRIDDIDFSDRELSGLLSAAWGRCQDTEDDKPPRSSTSMSHVAGIDCGRPAGQLHRRCAATDTSPRIACRARTLHASHADPATVAGAVSETEFC